MKLLSLFCFLILVIFALFLVPERNRKLLQNISIISSSTVLLASILLLLEFRTSYNTMQSGFTYRVDFDFMGFYMGFGADGLSIFFIVLTALLILVCVLFVINEPTLKYYLINLFLIELFLILVFTALDLLLFYIFFEAILIPMYLIIGVWGSRERKIRAVYLLFFYTLIGSLLMLIAIIYMGSELESFSYEFLLFYDLFFEEECFLWLAFFFSFASKIPIFPFHIWLPEAHVEAPTVGSVLLAGILLKLGVYGFIRFNLTLFPHASLYFSPLVYLLCTLGVIYASFSSIRQTDIKRIIAYSSVAHMNLITIGIFSFTLIGLEGAVLQSISHGFVSGALFLLVGILYDRYGSRYLYYYGGLAQVMPLYSVFFLIFTLSNIALPGTSSFVGEFLLLLSIFKVDSVLCFVVATSVIIAGSYSLWLYNRLAFGNLKISFMSNYNDLTLKEFLILSPLCALVFVMGIYPTFFTKYLHSVLMLILTGHFYYSEYYFLP